MYLHIFILIYLRIYIFTFLYIYISIYLHIYSVLRNFHFRSLHEGWKNLTQAEDNLHFYLTVYGCLAAGNSLFTLMRAFLFAYGGICAARIMHTQILDSILKVIVLA